MDAQKEQIAAAKAQNADILGKILSATQKVFLDCGDDFDRMKDPGKHRHKGGKHGRGKQDEDGDDDHGGPGHHGKRGKGHGQGVLGKMFDLADESTATSTGTSTSTATAAAADSQVCKDATAALKGLITPAG
jgi:hypothetical protein